MSLDMSPHYPVMLNEVVNLIQSSKKNTIVDCTFGCGGYSKKILELFPQFKIIAIDRDSSVKKFSEVLENKFKNRFLFINEKFSNIETIIQPYQDDIGFFIFDFGISSYQLDNYERGFSFNSEAKLDMRMGKNIISAFELINEASLEDLTNIIKIFGEDSDCKKIAKTIVSERQNKTIISTKNLRDIILKAKGNRFFKKDPCTKTFQAIRMVVNQELTEIFNTLKKTLEICKNDTGIVAVTFHSLEDKIVKKIFNISKDTNKNPSRYIPKISQLNEKTYLEKTNNKAAKPTKFEIEINPRSRSAKLRSIVKKGGDPIIINRNILNMEKLFELEEKYNG
jgi:16S rRNA (cytosine1402-N4)-methyltransferase